MTMNQLVWFNPTQGVNQLLPRAIKVVKTTRFKTIHFLQPKLKFIIARMTSLQHFINEINRESLNPQIRSEHYKKVIAINLLDLIF